MVRRQKSTVPPLAPMKTPIRRWIPWTLALALPLSLCAAEKSKAKSGEQAVLKVKEVVETSSAAHGSRKYDCTYFTLQTGTKEYVLQYKSLPEEDARDNPKDINDGCSGYGMVKPSACWYGHGFIDASMKGIPKTDIRFYRAKVKVLKDVGERVGYDLVFDTEGGPITVRTVAVGGRDELFVAVRGSTGAAGDHVDLEVKFRGYPVGFTGELDRWVHTASADLGNQGKTETTAALNMEKDNWALIADHSLTDPKGGQLGLLWLPGKLEKGTANHWQNYAVQITFSKADMKPEHRFMVCHFEGTTWQDAKKQMADLAKEAPSLIPQALDGWDSR